MPQIFFNVTFFNIILNMFNLIENTHLYSSKKNITSSQLQQQADSPKTVLSKKKKKVGQLLNSTLSQLIDNK